MKINLMFVRISGAEQRAELPEPLVVGSGSVRSGPVRFGSVDEDDDDEVTCSSSLALRPWM